MTVRVAARLAVFADVSKIAPRRAIALNIRLPVGAIGIRAGIAYHHVLIKRLIAAQLIANAVRSGLVVVANQMVAPLAARSALKMISISHAKQNRCTFCGTRLRRARQDVDTTKIAGYTERNRKENRKLVARLTL